MEKLSFADKFYKENLTRKYMIFLYDATIGNIERRKKRRCK